MNVDLIFSALSDPTRRGLFDRLRCGAATVSELAVQFPISRSAVSQHLAVLLKAGLVDAESSGRRRIYAVRAGAMDALAAYLRGTQASGAPMAHGAADPYSRALEKWRREAPHIDPVALALLMYFTRIGQHVTRSSEKIAAKAGLRYSDVTVLGALRRLGPPYESTPTRLASTFWITLPGMTKRLSKLETLGYLRRRSDPDDGRGAIIGLTPQGLKLLRDLVARHQPREYEALLQLEPAQRVELASTLSGLLDRIDRLHGHQPLRYDIRNSPDQR